MTLRCTTGLASLCAAAKRRGEGRGGPAHQRGELGGGASGAVREPLRPPQVRIESVPEGTTSTRQASALLASRVQTTMQEPARG